MKRENVMLLAALLLGLACVPEVPCPVGNDATAPYTVRLTPTPGQVFDASCPASLTGELVDLWNFELFGDEMGKPSIVAFRPIVLFDPEDQSESPIAQGSLLSLSAHQEAGQDICTVPSFTVATQGGLSYKVANMKLLEGARFQGHVFGADVIVQSGACEIQYTALGVWPAVTCTSTARCYPPLNASTGKPSCVTTSNGLSPDLQLECVPGPASRSWCIGVQPFPSVEICQSQ